MFSFFFFLFEWKAETVEVETVDVKPVWMRAMEETRRSMKPENDYDEEVVEWVE